MADDNEKKSEKVLLNGREVTLDELARQQEAVDKQKGAKMIEVSKGNFKIHLKD